jgi:hypothetical protein
MANPGLPTHDNPKPGDIPPGGPIPGDVPPAPPLDEEPDTEPTGPRSPDPVNDPGIGEPGGPGSEPDYLPGTPTNPGTRF